MFSERIRNALEREVVGQPEAVSGVARGVTRLASCLTPAERSWCSYLFIGPPGTGRSHLARSVARILYGHESVLTIHCKGVGPVDPWHEFLRRLEPLATPRSQAWGSGAASRETSANHGLGMARPLRLVLVQDLERANKDFLAQLAYLLESGEEVLPDGRRLRLDGCMFFFTSDICSDQILDESAIGFSSSTPDANGNEHATLDKICREEAENAFGPTLMGQFDEFVVFHRLDSDRLCDVLERYFTRMSHWLEERGIRSELCPSARDHLLELATLGRRSGAHDLARVHRHEVEFPLADLLVSGALETGSSVRVEHKPGDAHLHFSVDALETGAERAGSAREIPVMA